MLDLETLKQYKITKKILAKEFNSKEFEVQLCADEIIDLSNILKTITIVGTDVPAITTGTYKLDITIDGGSLNQLEFSISDTDDWDTIASSIETVLQTATSSSETVEISDNTFLVTSATTGVSSTVLIGEGTSSTGDPFLSEITSQVLSIKSDLDTPVDGDVGVSGYASISNILELITPETMVQYATPTPVNLHSAFDWDATHVERLVVAEYILDKIPVLLGSNNKIYNITKVV